MAPFDVSNLLFLLISSNVILINYVFYLVGVGWMAYVIASSLMNIIVSSFFNANAEVAQQNLNNDIIQEDVQISEPVPEEDSSEALGHGEVCQRIEQVDVKSSGLGLDLLGLGLHDEDRTADDSSLTPRPFHVQGDGQDYLQALPYVSANFDNEDSDADFRPIPPVYAQRYLAVKSVLLDEKWNGQIKKVIDFGCNDLAFFQYVKHMKGVEEVLLVDIDEILLKQSSCRVAPLNCDYLGNRESPLLVQILGGSIAEQDCRLIGTDAVICIELIEHLWPQEVEAVPYTVFGFIHPKVAIFTTPNADFNVVFKNFSGFRHPDHKFEWTREQFECWANNIVERYPAYEVTFHGIGAGPPSTEGYGCCSQMAVFVQRSADNQQAEIQPGEVYKLICDYNYPFRVDDRTIEEKIRHEAEYYIHRYSKDDIHYLDDGTVEIPLITLLPHVETWCNSIGNLRKILEAATWNISDRNPEMPAVVYPYYSAYSSSEEEGEEEHETSVLSQEKFVDEDYFQSPEDWDQCEMSPDVCSNKAGSSSAHVCQSNGCKEFDCRGETIVSYLLPLKAVSQETVDFTDSTSPLLPGVGTNRNSEHASFSRAVKGATSTKPGSWARTSDNTKQVNGSRNGSDSDTVLYRSSAVGSVVEGDSVIVMDARPSSARSMVDVAPSHAAHLPSLPSPPSVDRVETPAEEGSDSSRSFFLDLLSREREAAEQRMDLDQSPEDEEDGDESSDEGSVRSAVDNRARPRVQPHRNHFPFGLNAAVENGDVANNNRDGEGNNAVAFEELDEEDDDEDEDDEAFAEDEAGDHEDEDNANDVVLPDHADPFPPWLLHLLQVANEDGIELGAAGEPHVFLGDI